MSSKLFREGGPHQIKHLGGDQYRMSITLPTDEDGRLARECPNPACSPGYFKVKPGTGITDGQSTAYCPYCRRSADPNEFSTREQVRYAKDLVLREAQKGLDEVIKDALGLGPSGKRKIDGGLISIEMSYKPGRLLHVQRPYEDEVRRDVVCPHCKLDHTVFGLATWCPDCGEDIFLTHVEAELNVFRHMLSDVTRRKELFGARVAAKDLENLLEDAVSLFEATMKAIVRRALLSRGRAAEKVELEIKRFGNAFQNIAKTKDRLKELFQYTVVEDAYWATLATAFEKRHPIAHNLGVVDRKYLERAQAAVREGREIRVTASEVEDVLSAVNEVIRSLYQGLVRIVEGDGA